jgi:hypothetical protein
MERASEARAAQAQRGSLGKPLAGARGGAPLSGFCCCPRFAFQEIRVGVAGRNEAVTKPAAASAPGNSDDSPDRPNVIRLANSVAVLSGSKEFPRQFHCPKYIRYTLQVVSHYRDADFSSCTGQSTHQQTGMSEDAVFDRSEGMFNRASAESHRLRRYAFLHPVQSVFV